jgi:hypothetical protein
MQTFIAKILLLGLIVIFCGLLVSYVPDLRHDFKNNETESNLFVTPSNEHYGMVLLGTSHGRIFSRSGNHARVEEILGKKVLNLSTGGGRGVYSTELYLDYFYKRDNTADTIVYLIDPFVLYSNKWNEENDLFSMEPLRFDFLQLILKRKVNLPTVLNYLKTKLSWEWVMRGPSDDAEQKGALTAADPEAVKKRVESLYPDGRNEETFARYRAILESIAATAKDRNTRLIFVIPSTLLGNLPGEDELKKALADLQKTHNIEWHDFSNAITDPRLYYDHDHLNTEGIVTFAEQFLVPTLKKTF